MSKASKMTAVYERDTGSGWWTVQLKEESGAISQGRTVEEARRRIRKALAALWNDDAAAARVEIVDDVRLPAHLRMAVSRFRRATEKRTQVEAQAKACTQAAIQEAARFGLSLQDTSGLLGISRQRVHQRTAGAHKRSQRRA
jgi:predicted RNase H-like HicB family nuclease